jgi:two-component system CheB/CheR fusion protein
MRERKATTRKRPAAPREDPALETAPVEASHPAGAFPIVGIGASAGGLSAFEAFFSGMPADTDPGMAFILVQHLAPDHKSLLADLIRRHTRMQVSEVEDGMMVHPNCAYIIPPNRDMAFQDGRLRLMEPAAPRGQRLPIDFFFRSLARDQRERAICVVLSGTGSDGTLGLRAIKGEGGMAMAQSPETTEYDGMPRNAIATGLVDYTLAPAAMPSRLIAYANRAYGRPRSEESPLEPEAETILRKIFILMRAQTGHDFSMYKRNTIMRRIERRMAVLQIETMEGFLKQLQRSPGEVEALFRDLLIGVTSFFRDPDSFKALEEAVLPRLFADREEHAAIRIWVPGCATGEEAYSIAILLREAMESRKHNLKVQVFASDIDSHALGIARVGVYPASVAADIPPRLFSRYFVPENEGEGGKAGSYRVHKTIRDMLIFSEQSMIKDPPFSKLDLVSCRNLLIYMGSELQKRIIPLFHYALNPGGFLMLGTSETVGEFSELFTPVDRKAKLYQRVDYAAGAQRLVMGRFLPPPLSPAPPALTVEERPPSPARKPLRDLLEQSLLRIMAPAAVLVDGQGDILYIHGHTGAYLEPTQGEAGVSNIIKMAREGLRRDLTLALRKASSGAGKILRPRLRVRTNSHFTMVDLSVSQVSGRTGAFTEAPLYLVVFEESRAEEASPPAPAGEADPAATKAASPPDAAADRDKTIAELTLELRAKDEYIQATTEELETSNEELKSSNEEMQSVNEELQSTNEELETSKEELQSVNEELTTVNTELQNKVADLTQVNNDMNNLLAGTGIGTVFVDHQLRILRFTPAATRIINLIQGDVGRPVAHLVSNLVGYDNLVSDVQEVLDRLIPKEREAKTNAGCWYTIRILPYRTLENVIEGAVVTFVDISEAKKAREALVESESQLRQLAEALPQLVWTCLPDGACDYLCPRWIDYAGLEEAGWRGVPWLELIHPEDRAALAPAWERCAATGEAFSARLRILRADGAHGFFDARATALRDGAGRVVKWFGACMEQGGPEAALP